MTYKPSSVVQRIFGRLVKELSRLYRRKKKHGKAGVVCKKVGYERRLRCLPNHPFSNSLLRALSLIIVFNGFDSPVKLPLLWGGTTSFHVIMLCYVMPSASVLLFNIFSEVGTAALIALERFLMECSLYNINSLSCTP